MIIKYSYVSQLSYEVSDEEKEKAEKALMCFDYLLKSLNIATEHLDLMVIPFKNHPDIKSEELIKYRSALRKYRDKVIENFNSLKLMALKCVNAMDLFNSDTQVSKLMRSFISSIDMIEDKVNDFASLFNKFKSDSFVNDVIKTISELHDLCDELEEIVDDRIKGHIKTNIIGKNWIDEVSKKTNLKINKETPMMADLLQDKQQNYNIW